MSDYSAKSCKSLMKDLNHQTAWRILPEVVSWIVEKAIEIQQIPAPTFDEKQRAVQVASEFRALGFESIDMDERSNVYGVLPGKDRSLPGVMIAAHTDTVFPSETDLTIRRENGTIYGPGLGDNSLGVAGMLGMAEFLRREEIIPACDLRFVATSREEGLGDLGGIKLAFAREQPHIKAVINLEGLAFGHIYHAGIAVRRLHITALTGGGHSWIHFGRASAIHGIIDLGARILTIRPPESPRTTYNIGLVDGGQSINTIAAKASMWLDLRSETRDTLEALEQQVHGHIQAAASDELRFEVEIVGDRPAGFITPDHPLVLFALAALDQLGVSGSLETGSTDANVPLSAGCPAVTIGITQGGNAHRIDEFIKTDMIESGLRQLILLTLAASEWQA